jgi:hypothetical protein
MLTDSELTQARLLSSPEIPDDDETAKQPTRQLVRKMLAHIDEVTKNRDEIKAEGVRMYYELHAALDAKEKAEAKSEEWRKAYQHAECEFGKCTVAGIGLDKKVAELQAENAALKDASVSTGNELNKLQSIVDRLPLTADGVPLAPGTLFWQDEEFHYSSGKNIILENEHRWMPAHECYSTREAALSAAASSAAAGAKGIVNHNPCPLGETTACCGGNTACNAATSGAKEKQS